MVERVAGASDLLQWTAGITSSSGWLSSSDTNSVVPDFAAPAIKQARSSNRKFSININLNLVA